ncbi:MAG: LuxR C-terminal-related transcriptional regulator [Saprospiraceae bacterium]
MNNTLHIKVFVTDDHPVVICGVGAMLASFPDLKLVGSAASGAEMMLSLPKARPHVLLLDINMPGTDFYENIAWVKEQAPWVKILVYSEYYSPELVKSLLHAGVMGFVPKSASSEELLEAIVSVGHGEAYVAPPAHAQSDSCSSPEHHPELEDGFRKRLGLSRREQEVLVLISHGLSSQRIGKTLFISKHTVETHRKNMLRKLDFNSSTELVKFAVQQGLV